jgi:hypothetical protein
MWVGSNGHVVVDGIQVGEVMTVRSEQVRQCMELEHCLHRLHLEPTAPSTLGAHSPLIQPTTILTLAAHPL